jgi:hypothetical protein
MRNVTYLLIAVFALSLILADFPHCFGPLSSGGTACAADQAPSPEKIEWFRDKLHIAEKYQRQQQGVMGMSWGHFLSMVFLVVFFVGASAIAFYRAKRSREILEAVMRERAKEKSGSGEGA